MRHFCFLTHWCWVLTSLPRDNSCAATPVRSLLLHPTYWNPKSFGVFFPAVHGEEQRSSTSTGIFSTKSASAQITLQIKSFSYKCAYVMELIASFLRVINKQGWEGRTGSRICSRRNLKYTKNSDCQKPLCSSACPKLELLRSTQLPDGSGHLLPAHSLQQLFPKGLWALLR